MTTAKPLADALPKPEICARQHPELSAVRFSLLAVIARFTQAPGSGVDSVGALARNLERALGVLSTPSPVDAARRWLIEATRAWATLDVLFADSNGSDERAARCRWHGVTGELRCELERVLELEYAHLLAEGPKRATECLRRDCDELSIDVAAADALRRALGDADTDDKRDWFGTFQQQCFALAEYMHRNVLGLQQVLSDHEAMRYATAMCGAVRGR